MKILTQFVVSLLLALVAVADSANTPLPYPFQPPSTEFCASNSLGDDTYFSFFVPCDFIFYDSTIKPEQFTCDDESYSDEFVIEKEQIKVAMWPDSCVASGPRCYSIQDYPGLYNFTYYPESEFSVKFPEKANVVSVDCSADFAKAQAFMENLPDELVQVADSIGKLASVLFMALTASVVACICCFCLLCRGRRYPRGTFTEVQPVQAVPYKYNDHPKTYNAVAV